ncbi:peptidoglycan editing factor PgeF [Alteromonas sediminis]|nr:peptidoglycan editing factor PgeF [Alteromonas sediminis]
MNFKGLDVLTPNWPLPCHVVAYSTTRIGGVSKGNFASLNLAQHVGDSVEDVLKNRSLLPFSQNIQWLDQVHSNRVVEAVPWEHSPQADACYCQENNVFCAVMTADCVPILLSNRAGTEVAAVHAGWKGLESGIISNTLERMKADSTDIFAWIGPCISQPCYEVGADVVGHFIDDFPEACKPNSAQKWQLDLPGIAETQLSNGGVDHIFKSKMCTYMRSDLFFSHRFATHQSLSSTGRIASVIGILSP